MRNAIDMHGRNYDAIKREFLSSAHRRQGETLWHFYTRVQTAYVGMCLEEPDHDSVWKDQICQRMLSCFPPAFQITFKTDDERKDPATILNEGYEWVHEYPQLRLRDEDIFKERKDNPVTPTSALTTTCAKPQYLSPKKHPFPLL